MSKYVFVAAGLLVAMGLGATVFSDPIAQAAQTVSATIIGPLDGNGNVAVHEQGTGSGRTVGGVATSRLTASRQSRVRT